MSKKLILALVMVVVLVGGLFAACAKPAPPAPAPVPAPVPAPAPAPAPYVWDFSLYPAQDSTTGRSDQLFIDLVHQRSGGRIKLNAFWSGSLAGSVKASEGVIAGTIPMADTKLFPAADKRVDMMYWPFLTDSWDQGADFYYPGGIIYEYLSKIAEERGIKYLGATDNDFRGISNSKRPVRTPQDAKGLSLRMPEQKLFMVFWGEVGVTSTVINFAELFTALQQKTVDGQENGPSSTYYSKLYEAQKHFTDIRWAYGTNYFMINLKLFKSLPEDLQKVLQFAGEEASSYSVEDGRRTRVLAMDLMEKAGLQVIRNITPEERAAWKAVAKKVEPSLRELVGDEAFQVAQQVRNLVATKYK